MRALEQETNIEVLREFAKYALQELLKTKEELALERQKKLQVEQLRLKYEDQLLVFRKMIFARGREKRADSSDRPRSTEEDFLLTHSQSLAPAPKPYAIKDLEIEEVIAEMTDLELEEESKIRGFEDPSSSDWKKMPGFFDESTQVHVIERKYVKKVIKRQKYESTREIESEESKKVIITANHPEQLIVGGSYTVDFAVSVIADKYISHMPLERQCKEMASLGLLKMQPKTLYNLCFIGSVHLEKVAEKIKNDILKAYRCLHLDESPWPINTKKEDDGYMWVLSNQAGSYYRFETTRSGDIAKELLKNQKNIAVLTDGYRGYNKLAKIEGIVIGNCWAHVRRKFFEIRENYPTEATEILDLIDELHRVERQARSFEDLMRLRREKSKSLIDKIETWLIDKGKTARPESGIAKAINYTQKLWPGLTAFLNDERLPLTNNDAERAIRHAVMGRKNFYGSRSINGADVAATLYTIIESCKRVELDPRSFSNVPFSWESVIAQNLK